MKLKTLILASILCISSPSFAHQSIQIQGGLTVYGPGYSAQIYSSPNYHHHNRYDVYTVPPQHRYPHSYVPRYQLPPQNYYRPYCKEIPTYDHWGNLVHVERRCY